MEENGGPGSVTVGIGNLLNLAAVIGLPVPDCNYASCGEHQQAQELFG
jgi:hypothetical protein